MPSWYEQPYRGGGPAKVKGFPRALYPPDAAEYGKTPSSRGPDVMAYKRTICRLGRWGYWDPSSWDDGYWDDFAHGIENPKKRLTSGVAGVQYQQHIDATGWLGLSTFNALCYALVPNDPSFPHAGEQAMDGYAVDLINEAWKKFQGHEPPPAEKTTLRVKALNRARDQIGYVEGPNNDNKYGKWYGANNQPYCAMGLTWSYENEGESPSFVQGSRYAYVPYIVADARNGRYGLKVTGDPIPGDLVCYDWQWNGEFDHVGLFEQWKAGTAFTAIEFNTSPEGSGGSQSNGGGVYRRTRNLNSQSTVFVRVTEP